MSDLLGSIIVKRPYIFYRFVALFFCLFLVSYLSPVNFLYGGYLLPIWLKEVLKHILNVLYWVVPVSVKLYLYFYLIRLLYFVVKNILLKKRELDDYLNVLPENSNFIKNILVKVIWGEMIYTVLAAFLIESYTMANITLDISAFINQGINIGEYLWIYNQLEPDITHRVMLIWGTWLIIMGIYKEIETK